MDNYRRCVCDLGHIDSNLLRCSCDLVYILCKTFVFEVQCEFIMFECHYCCVFVPPLCHNHSLRLYATPCFVERGT